MTTRDSQPPHNMDEVVQMNEEQAGIKDQGWAAFDPGSTVVSADGDEIGTVREKMPLYLVLRAKRNLLSEVELYLPREHIDRVESDRIVLSRTAAEIEKMDLTRPPAEKQS